MKKKGSKTKADKGKGAGLKEDPEKVVTTKLPAHLEEGIDALSGMSKEEVKVHYNSAQPAHLKALTYAKATDISLATGHEAHLPHEAWHVVQQKQGRVQAKRSTDSTVIKNKDGELEKEADQMGEKAIRKKGPDE